MKTIVDRRTWLRGEGNQTGTSLRRPRDGKQCCLGFIAKELGQTDIQINMIGNLFGIADSVRTPAMVTLLVGQSNINNNSFNRAIALNDIAGLQEDVREWAIQQALAPLDIEIEFIN